MKKGVLLVNLGTPNAPTKKGLRTYLNQFLTDRRVIDMKWPFRYALFQGIIVPIRSGKVSKLYQKLWMDDGSPLKVYGQRVAKGVQETLGDAYQVELAMRYQNPSIESALKKLRENHVTDITIFPLFPQYASATTGSVFEEVMSLLRMREQLPNLRFISSYYNHKDIIDIYSKNARAYDLSNYDHFIFSFHGVPERYLKKENEYCKCDGNCCKTIVPKNNLCYSAQCHATAYAIANQLNLSHEAYTVSYQSRFGPEKWLQPYTDEVLEHQVEQGNKKILVFSPAFVADCLETTIEIGYEYKEEFIEAGGEKLDLVASLNEDPAWISFIAKMVA